MGAESTPSRRILIVDDDRALRHALSSLLTAAGHHIESVGDGPEALALLHNRPFDIVLLDIGLPSMSGLDVLARVCEMTAPPRVVMMTADDTSQSVLEAVKRQAYRYIRKPFPPNTIVDVVNEAVAPAAALSFEVVSARPEWLEFVAPCTIEMADRIHSFVMHLEASLPEDVREAVAQAFRELLMNAVEWGGKLDPSRKVRIAYLRAKRMLLYRIADPGSGFSFEGLLHAAVGQPADQPIAHMEEREKMGIRPGGFGILTVRAKVDELLYNEAQNEVVFVKYLD